MALGTTHRQRPRVMLIQKNNMSFNPRDYDDYPMGDEKSYQNRKKYGMEMHPNSRAAKRYKKEAMKTSIAHKMKK